MASLFIHHKVQNYAAWRPFYDGHESSRVGAGITDAQVFRNVEDANDIVIVATVADLAQARALMLGDETKATMQKAGVIAAPSIHFIS